jgi:hypothetical protein
MLMVIVLHALGHGGVLGKLTPFDGSYYIYETIEAISFVAVNVFIIISGYYLCYSKFKIFRVVKLIGQVFFISLLIYLILVILKLEIFSIKNLFYSIFPVSTGQYGFVTNYIILCCMSPFINIMISNMSQKIFKRMLIIMLIFFCIIPNVFFFVDPLLINHGQSLVWFIILYLIAAYIRIHVDLNKINMNKLVKKYLAVTAIIPLSKFCLDWGEWLISKKFLGSGIFYFYNSIPVVASSILLFCIFTKINITKKMTQEVIKFLSEGCFYVYLIHDNPFVREHIWTMLNMPDLIIREGVLSIIVFIILIIFIYIIALIIGKVIDMAYTQSLYKLMTKFTKAFNNKVSI